MAKFCRNCGSQVEEGQICICQQQYSQPQQQYTQPQVQQYAPQPQYTGQPQYAPPVPAAPSAAGMYFKRLWNLIIGLVKAPATVGAQFTNSCDFKLAFGLIGAQAFAMALLFVSFAAKINSVSGATDSSQQFPIVTIFLLGAILTFGLACLLPVLMVLFIKIFKGNTTYKYMLCVSGVNNIIKTPFVLVSVLLSLVMTVNTSSMSNIMTIVGPFYIPLIVAFFGTFLGSLTSVTIIKGGAYITDDKAIYVRMFTSVVMLIALFICLQVVVPMCLPPALKSVLELAGGISKLLFG